MKYYCKDCDTDLFPEDDGSVYQCPNCGSIRWGAQNEDGTFIPDTSL